MIEYYVYENWVADPGGKARVHKGVCGNCQYGEGKHTDKDEGRNGRWHGPFSGPQMALRFAKTLNKTITGFAKYCLRELEEERQKE